MTSPVVHFEIGCRELGKTVDFNTELFGWKSEPYGQAAMIQTGSDEGIQGHITSLGHEPHQYVTFYIRVDDLQATLDWAEQLGATRVVPPTEIPGMGSFAWFSDPGGNVLGLWKPLEKQ